MLSKEDGKKIVEDRIDSIVDTIKRMKDEDLFPIPVKEVLFSLVVQKWYEYGKEIEFSQKGSGWTLSDSYLNSKWNDGSLERALRDKKLYLAGEIFKGNWNILSEKEYKEHMTLEQSGLNTREERYNDRVTDANSRWKSFNMPLAEPVKQLN